MGNISRRMVDALIRIKEWEPYIKSHWMILGKSKGGVIITFKGHETKGELWKRI